MSDRPYFSIRRDRESGQANIGITKFRELVKAVFTEFEGKDYFVQWMGYKSDGDRYVGKMGTDVEHYAFLRLRKRGLFPPVRSTMYSEGDLFDLIEFMYQHVSVPLRSSRWRDGGVRYDIYDEARGKTALRNEVNRLLPDYGDGWELSSEGEILKMLDPEVDSMLEPPAVAVDDDNVESRLTAAIKRFRLHGSSEDDRRLAIVELASVLEFLRPKVGELLSSQDEKDLFNIANNYGIRHHNPSQKTEYDSQVWLPWMFCYYLGTIRTLQRLMAKSGS